MAGRSIGGCGGEEGRSGNAQNTQRNAREKKLYREILRLEERMKEHFLINIEIINKKVVIIFCGTVKAKKNF